MSDCYLVSTTLLDIADLLEGDAPDLARIAGMARETASLARLQEGELNVHRLRQADRQRGDVLEHAAVEVMTEAMVARDDNVVRPNIWGKS